MRWMLRRTAEERGIALVLALMIMAALAAGLTTAIVVSSSSGRTASLGSAEQRASTLAEAGINDAMGVLRLQTNNALDPSVFCTSSTQTLPCWVHESYSGGTVDWMGTLDTATAKWSLTSIGTVANPSGPGSTSLRKTMTATVQVHPTLTQPLNTPIWNYMYATKPASPLPTCDMTLNNSVVVNSPLYVEGNLCIQQSAGIKSGPLVVKGRLYLSNIYHSSNNPGNYVGLPSAPVSDVHILNGCNYSGLLGNPCNKRDGTYGIWANSIDQTVPNNLTAPTIEFDKWYLNGSPGPYFPCQTIGGRAPIAGYPVFDTPVAAMTADDPTKLTYKNNNQGNQNLTPSSSYRCETDAGSLIWDAQNRKLTISGTIYVDGSLYVTNGAVNSYQGQGVIYVSGTYVQTGSKLCGSVLNGACDNRTPSGTCAAPTGGWDPNCNLLVIVAGGSGGQASPGDSVQLTTTSDLQAALFGTGAVDIGQQSLFAGPIVGSSIILGQSVQTNFPVINVVPNGMPSNPTAYAYADPPLYG